MLFRMVPKQYVVLSVVLMSFRAMLFRMVPKLRQAPATRSFSFRAMLFRMVPKRGFSQRNNY